MGYKDRVERKAEKRIEHEKYKFLVTANFGMTD